MQNISHELSVLFSESGNSVFNEKETVLKQSKEKVVWRRQLKQQTWLRIA